MQTNPSRIAIVIQDPYQNLRGRAVAKCVEDWQSGFGCYIHCKELHNVIKLKLQNGSRKLWTERTVTELRLLCLRSTAANGEKQRKVIRIAGPWANIWTQDNLNMKQDSYSLACNVQYINSHILSQELLNKRMSIEFTVATPCSLIPMSVVLTFCDRPF